MVDIAIDFVTMDRYGGLLPPTTNMSAVPYVRDMNILTRLVTLHFNLEKVM